MTDNIINDRAAHIETATQPDALRQELLQALRSETKTPLQGLQESLSGKFRIPPEFPEIKDPPEFVHRFAPHRFGIEEKLPTQTATPERIEQVRRSMEKSVNELIPESEQATLKQLRDGILTANPMAIEKAYESLKDNPKLMHAMIKELNNEFKAQGTDVSFSMSDDNRLLVSSDGQNGIEFGANGPEAKQVTRGQDGYIHLSQEQGTNLPLDKIAKSMQQNACRDENDFLYLSSPYETGRIFGDPQQWRIKPYEPKHLAPGEIWDKAQDFKALH